MMEPSPPQGDPNQGKVLAETYQIIRLLGQGGMGKVYEVGHLRLTKKRYAVKLLQSDSAADPEAYARFRREAEIATEIGHPHIVEVHDFNITGEGQPFIVMELLEGEDLFDHVKRLGRLPRPEVARIITQVAAALTAAHGAGIVHRDLKPENIFLVRGADGTLTVKLLDFGLSKIKHCASRLTAQNAVFGTPHYMAPEQADGKADDVDHRTDIYALAVIVYQCLCGEVPFDAPTPLGVLYKVCHEAAEPVSRRAPGIPPEIDAILARAMARRREDRYQSVEAFLDELGPVLERPGRMGSMASTPTPTPIPAVEAAGPNPAARLQRSDTEPELTAPPKVPMTFERGTLPPGAPPLPRDALKTPAGVPVPSVVITDPALSLSRVASGEIEIPGTPPERPAAPAVAATPSGELAIQASLHDADTGEVEAPPIDAGAAGADPSTSPFVRGEPAAGARVNVVALVIFVLALVAAFVAVALITANLGEGP